MRRPCRHFRRVHTRNGLKSILINKDVIPRRHDRHHFIRRGEREELYEYFYPERTGEMLELSRLARKREAAKYPAQRERLRARTSVKQFMKGHMKIGSFDKAYLVGLARDVGSFNRSRNVDVDVHKQSWADIRTRAVASGASLLDVEDLRHAYRKAAGIIGGT